MATTMATTPHLIRSSLPGHHHLIFTHPHTQNLIPKFTNTNTTPIPKPRHKSHFPLPHAGPGGGNSASGGHGGYGGGGGGNSNESPSDDGFAPIAALVNGWRSRVAADPQFPFKVLMEELVGVSACLVGDMSSRPNFGLDELDFVFSTLVVGSILNFMLMYILAPTSSSSLPSIFSSSPASHMFEPGPYTLTHRLGTFVYKGAVFAAAGFAAGVAGTAISNGLVAARKRMDPGFETPNKAPPVVLNSATWALQLGVSSNLRYQTLNGIEFVLAKALPPMVFRSTVVVLRCLNNVVGGMSFVTLARLTGSQVGGGAAAAPAS